MGRETGAIRRRFALASLVVVAFAAFALASAPKASAQESLAASCEPPTQDAVVAAQNQIFAQTFVSGLTGSLTRVEIEIVHGQVEGGDYVIEIRTVDDSTGAPTNVVLAVATVDAADLQPTGPGGPGTVQYTRLNVVFASPASVLAGEEYAVSVRRPGAGDFAWGAGTGLGGACAGEVWFSDDGGAAWEDLFQEHDFYFAVFVTPDSPTSFPACKAEQATHVGTAGDDVIEGTDGPDVIVALGGNDKVLAGDGEDLVCGNRGRDWIRGQDGKDKLFGSRGKDRLFGGAKADLLVGGAKGDSLFGGGGKDKLRGGSPDAPGKDAQDLCRGGTAQEKLKNCER